MVNQNDDEARLRGRERAKLALATEKERTMKRRSERQVIAVPRSLARRLEKEGVPVVRTTSASSKRQRTAKRTDRKRAAGGGGAGASHPAFAAARRAVEDVKINADDPRGADMALLCLQEAEKAFASGRSRAYSEWSWSAGNHLLGYSDAAHRGPSPKNKNVAKLALVAYDRLNDLP